jgi:phage gp36-like protein
MSYCTVDQVLTALDPVSLAQLTDDLQAQDIAVERIDEAIQAAEAEIDGYLGMVVALPLATAPALLGRLAVQMALYHLFLRRNQGAYREVEYQNCRALLRDIAAGRVSLGLAAADAPLALRLRAL